MQKSYLNILKELGFDKPTLIQNKIFAIKPNKDFLAQAKTGAGKTLAFLIPAVASLNNLNLEVLILTPTRELALQIGEVLKSLAKSNKNIKFAMLIGGQSLLKQALALQNDVNIAIATPGRLIDIISKGLIDLNNINKFIIDEADIMLNMGFRDDVLKISASLPANRQTMLFSATFKESIKSLIAKVLNKPLVIEAIEQENALKEYYIIAKTTKEQTLANIVQNHSAKKIIIFCETKQESYEVYKYLKSLQICATYINGDLEQDKRDEHLITFKNGSKRVLVATDLASRGLDIKSIDLIINFTLPLKKETYTHRVGRTARAGNMGEVINICKKYDLEKLQLLANNPKEFVLVSSNNTFLAKYATIKLNAGKDKKIRASDIVGVLCKQIGVEFGSIGDIDIALNCAYIAIDSQIASQIASRLNGAKVKKRKIRAWLL